MAMKIPSAGNPFDVDVARRSVEGLVTPTGSVERAQAKHSAFQRQVDQWNAEQDELAANDLINQIRDNDEKLKNDESEGWANQKGKNASQRESGKSLADENGEKRKSFYDSLNIGAYSSAVRKKVADFNQAQDAYVRRDINRHIVREQAVYQESLDQQNYDQASKMIMSDNPEDVKGGIGVVLSLTHKRAHRAGVEPDYSKTLGGLIGFRISQDLDADNVPMAKQWLESSKKYMSAAQFYKASHAIKVAEKRVQSRVRGEAANAAYEKMFSDGQMAATAYEHATGKKMPEGLFETCLEIADGDPSKALEIAVIGVDEWVEEVSRAADSAGDDDSGLRSNKTHATVGMAGRKFNELKSELGKTSVYDIANRLKEIDPELEDEEVMRQARKISKRRVEAVKMSRASQDQASNSAFAMLNANTEATFDDIPPSLAQNLSKETREGLRRFSDRRSNGSLVNDYAKREHLLENPEILKNMSDSQFLAMAGDFEPNTFNELASYRSALNLNQAKPSSQSDVEQQVRRAFVAQNVNAPVNGKALQGLVVEMIAKAIRQESANAKDMGQWDDARVTAYVGDFLANSFTPETWGFNTEHTFRAIASGNVASFGSTLEKILDKGLDAGQGIKEPSNLNRTKLMMEMLFFPNRNVAGSQAMVEYISAIDGENSREIKKVLGAKYTHARFLEMYLRSRPDLITSTLIKAEQ